jgi:hypothetical protein
MAAQMLRFLDEPIPRENIRTKSAELSWANYAKVIINA